MPRRPSRSAPSPFDPTKVENVLQLGGIRTAVMDTPAAGGTGGVRVALVDTGGGLRFTVALDRGGDIVDAHYHSVSLAYLTPNGLKPPSPAYNRGAEWLRGWAGGLVTTCGPEYIGAPRVEKGVETTLHGRYSNTPSVVETLRNPDPRRGQWEMSLGLVVRDTRAFGPNYEIRRTLRCTLGQPEVTIEDQVTNCGDTTAQHHWLYHCNLGYPLLDEGARFIYGGKAVYWVVPPPEGQNIVQPLSSAAMNRLKRVPAPMREHAGGAERGVIADVTPQPDGQCRIGVINPRLKLGLEFTYPSQAMPRMANWQHFGPDGCYVSGLEPFHGSLLGSAREQHPAVDSTLAAGETRRYSLRVRVLTTAAEIQRFSACDHPLRSTGILGKDI